MVDRLFPLLRGQTVARDFKPVVGGTKPASRPRPDPVTHRQRLLAQLDSIVAEVGARPPSQRDPEQQKIARMFMRQNRKTRRGLVAKAKRKLKPPTSNKVKRQIERERRATRRTKAASRRKNR